MAEASGGGSLLRSRDHHAAVPPEELLFDLVYVFAITQLSHFLLEHMTARGALEALVLWLAVWLGWQYTAWFTNWFNPENPVVRVALFSMMLLSLMCAVVLPEAFGAYGLFFAISYATMEVGRSLWVLFNLEADSPLRPNYQRISTWMIGAGILWIAGGLAQGDARLALWAAAVLVQYVAPMTGFAVPGLGRSSTREWTIDGAHLAERCQLLVIVALGETVVATGATMARAEHVDLPTIIAFVLSFLGTLSLWWIYFGTSSKDGAAAITQSDDPGRMGAQFHYTHVVLIGGIIICAVANDLVIAHPDGHLEWKYVAVLYGGPAIYLIGNALFKRIVYGAWPVSHFAGLALLAVTAPLAHFSDLLVSGAWTTLVTLIVAIWDYRQRQREPQHERIARSS